MTTISEYLPDASEEFRQAPGQGSGFHGHNSGNGHGNGHNGQAPAGQGKVFTLRPATDPDTLSILDARRNALAEPPERLSRSMKACFCEILDRALHPGFFDVKGVVTISDTVLAEIFSVSDRTIYTWKKKLEGAGYVWLTKKWKSNMWPITTYHLTCLHRPQRQEKTDRDGTYGGGRLRPAPANPGLGARRPGQPDLPLPGSRQPPAEHENPDLQGISAQSREKLRVSPDQKIGSEPKKRSGESRSKDRLRAEEKIGSEPIKRSAQSRSEDPARAEADFRHIETQNRVTGDQESLKTVNRLNNRSVEGEGDKKPAAKLSPRQLESEKDFLDHCEQVLGKKEMDENGGLWRTSFRHGDKKKCWACLHEIRSMVKEQRIKTTPAKAMMDLWKRWREDKP